VHLAARTGYGIAYLGLLEVFDDLRSGALVRVLSDFPAAGVPVNLVYPSRRNLAPRTRLVMDFIWEQVRQVLAELETASDVGALPQRGADTRSVAFIGSREALIGTSTSAAASPKDAFR
jgi:hypothetical protein